MERCLLTEGGVSFALNDVWNPLCEHLLPTAVGVLLGHGMGWPVPGDGRSGCPGSSLGLHTLLCGVAAGTNWDPHKLPELSLLGTALSHASLIRAAWPWG